jgi:hypothetical protein
VQTSSTTLGHGRTRNDLQFVVLEPHVAGIHDFDSNILLTRPVGVQSRRQQTAEPVLDPDQRPLVVLQVQNNRALG